MFRKKFNKTQRYSR